MVELSNFRYSFRRRKLATFSYSFRQHDEKQFIFVDEVLVLVLVDKKTLIQMGGSKNRNINGQLLSPTPHSSITSLFVLLRTLAAFGFFRRSVLSLKISGVGIIPRFTVGNRG